tara:strand:- start:12681 stop:13802 length:1122 start_codon:yes stop_codon:yes gene_type:complete
MSRGCGMFYLPNFSALAHAGECSGKKLAVVDKSRAYALSPEMVGSGIQVGFGISRITSLDPECILIPRNKTLEQAYCRNVMDDLYETSPQISIQGELGQELWVGIKNFDKRKLKRCIKKYSAKAGYARTQSLCKLAARKAACAELLVIPPDKEGTFLKTFKTTDLRYFGFSLECLATLDLLGFRDLSVLSRLTVRHLTAQFGREGRHLFEFLTDKCQTQSIPNWNPNRITIENSVESNYSDLDYEKQIINATNIVLNQGKMGIVSIAVHLRDKASEMGVKTFNNPTRDVNKITDLAMYLLRAMLQYRDCLTGYKIIFVLKELESVQAELWGIPGWKNLRHTLDRRFPQKFFIPNPLQATLVPEDANDLRPLNE